MLCVVTPAAPTTPATPAATQNPIQLSDLQNFLTGLGVAAGGTPGTNQPNGK